MKESLTVGYYKNLVIEILEMSDAGCSVPFIANYLGVAVLTVNNVLEVYGRPEDA
jgi:hypothetical protein